HRALVPLYQVDIARRNAQPLGDLGLRQPELLADPPEAGAHEEFLSGVGGHLSSLALSTDSVRLSPSFTGKGRRVAPGEGLSPRVECVERAPHPAPLPVKDGERENRQFRCPSFVTKFTK